MFAHRAERAGEPLCEGASANILSTRHYPSGGTFTYMSFELGNNKDATSQSAFVEPFLKGYLSYVRSPH